MHRRVRPPVVKPMLEQLEDRAQPSIVLSGGIPQLAVPMQNMIKDMQSAATDFNAQVRIAVNGANPQQQQIIAFGKATADWQRLQNDQHAIQATSSADVNFLNAAAFAELTAGDATDMLLLRFGPLIGFNPTKVLTDPVDQAGQILNDSTLLQSVNTLNGVLALENTTLNDLVPPPKDF